LIFDLVPADDMALSKGLKVLARRAHFESRPAVRQRAEGWRSEYRLLRRPNRLRRGVTA
jgi:hypothetical protein